VVRVTVWVRPGSPRPGVGGEHDGALVVRVSARAVDGRATAAALAALAAAFGVRRHDVTLVAGAANRKKIVDVAGADPAVLDRLLALGGLPAGRLGDGIQALSTECLIQDDRLASRPRPRGQRGRGRRWPGSGGGWCPRGPAAGVPC
jgi:uncharacterized protein